ncbi:MAG: cyclic nucleotide-binding/CBS domain-containing protein [Desulfovermiculus sp.]
MADNMPQNMLSDFQVRTAMRKNPLRLDAEKNLDQAISSMIKFKANALLIHDPSSSQDLGLITKTDLMTLYYAGFPLETVLGEVLVAPILTCTQDDTLETALSQLLGQGVKRIYVSDSQENGIVGVLSYADIVGVLYRFCRQCEKSLAQRRKKTGIEEALLVRDVMHQDVVSCKPGQTIAQSLELLSGKPFSALLVQETRLSTPGVLSKTDLILAYRHKLPLETPLTEIAKFPALSCAREEALVQALQRMILADVHRLFVHGAEPWDIQGVLSLTDAARARSGSCRACSATRLQ